MTARVEEILDAIRARPIDGQAVQTALLDIRTDQEQLLALLRRLIDDCHPIFVGWLLAPVCGWLTDRQLARAADEAQRHLQEHGGCQTAVDLLQHESLRRPDFNAPATVHVAFPEHLVREWSIRRPLRTGHPTWIVRAPDQPRATVGGPAAGGCPRCHGPGETLLGISCNMMDAVESRDSVDFVWCPACSPFTEATYCLVDESGHCALMELDIIIEVGNLSGPEPFPRTEVGLVDLGSEWRVQDWMWSDNIENLNRVGGLATWIHDEATPACSRCGMAMAFVGQIATADLTDGEGMTYLHWCDACSVTAVVYQRT